jgi:hypothetical protein
MLYFRRMPKRCMDLRLSKQDVYLMYLDPLLCNESFFLYGPTGTLASVRFPRFRLLQDHVIVHIYKAVVSRITRLRTRRLNPVLTFYMAPVNDNRPGFGRQNRNDDSSLVFAFVSLICSPFKWQLEVVGKIHLLG